MNLLSFFYGITVGLLLVMGWKWLVLRKRQRMIAILAHQINTLLTTARWHSELATGGEQNAVHIPCDELTDRVYVSLSHAMALFKELKHLASGNKKGVCTPPKTIDVRMEIEQELHSAPPSS